MNLTKREYSLEIEEIPEIESTKTIAFQSKGHHNKLIFSKAVKEFMTDERYNEYTVESIRSKTLHLWGKSVPWCGGGRRMAYSMCHKSGWFPVTVFKL